MNPQRQISMRKQTKSALERIDGLEDALNNLVLAINNALSRLEQKTTELDQVMTALVELTGTDAVKEHVQNAIMKRAEEKSAAEKAALEAALAEGTLVKADTVTEQSVIVGVEYNTDGNSLHPGRVQVLFKDLKEEFKTQLLGKGADFECPTPTGGKFKVSEVYLEVEKPVETETSTETVASEPVATENSQA